MNNDLTLLRDITLLSENHPDLHHAILTGVLTAIKETDINELDKAIAVNPDALHNLLSLVARSDSGGSGGSGKSGWIREDDDYFRFVGKQVLVRGGIFAYFTKCIDVTEFTLVGIDVCWLADTGDFEQLLQTPKDEHFSKKVTSTRTQYYKRDRPVSFAKSLFADVSEWDGDYSEKK